MTTKREFTAVYQKKGNRYVAWIEEVPGVNTQGKTKQEVRENLKEALYLILEANKKLREKNYGAELVRESFKVAIPV